MALESPSWHENRSHRHLDLQGNCYGCGAGLQNQQAGSAGYVNGEVYVVKKQHRQLGQVLCERCQALSHGGMIPGVLERTAARRAPASRPDAHEM